MSIENFQSIYPANREQLRDILVRQRDRETPIGKKSPVVLLALSLAREGGNGLRESSESLDSSNTSLGLTPQDLGRIPEGIRQEVIKNWATIMCGISIYSIDDTILNKAFSYELVASLHDMMINGTLFSPLPVGQIKEEAILDDKYRGMISLARGDKTLTSFLEAQNTRFMPNGLMNLLNRMRIMPTIRSDIIPIFKPRAQLVVG